MQIKDTINVSIDEYSGKNESRNSRKFKKFRTGMLYALQKKGISSSGEPVSV